MSDYSATKNRQMQAMLEPAIARLKTRSKEELCEKGGLLWKDETQMFHIASLGQEIHVAYPTYQVQEELSMWHELTLLQYMDTADGTPLTGEFIGLQQMPGGLSRGNGFNRDLDTMFAHDFGDFSAELVEEACKKLGGKILQTRADVTAIIDYAPHFPIMINFYEGDEEFHAAGKALVDKNAHHYLAIEAAGGACSTVVNQIRDIAKTL